MLFALLALAVPLAAARAASTAADHARFLEAFGSLDGTLERVKPDGTPQCGDSVKLNEETRVCGVTRRGRRPSCR